MHDVVQPLAEMIRRRNLPKASFDELIEARLEDTEEAALSLANLVDRATAIGAPLVTLAARILGEQDVSTAAKYAGQGSRVDGLCPGHSI